jgi:hypothetical protein
MEEKRNVYRILVGNTEGKKPVQRNRRRWEHSNKIDLREILCDVMDWINLVQSRDQCWAIVNTVMNLQIP